jgi:hypothetical protein
MKKKKTHSLSFQEDERMDSSCSRPLYKGTRTCSRTLARLASAAVREGLIATAVHSERRDMDGREIQSRSGLNDTCSSQIERTTLWEWIWERERERERFTLEFRKWAEKSLFRT